MPLPQQKPILVSACLLGLDCRYNGLGKKNSFVLDFLQKENRAIIPVCPEQLAGLPTPRPATQFTQGDGASILAGEGLLRNADQECMNASFIKGAEQVLAIARMNRCQQAIMKERSPSCGVRQVSRNDQIVSGSGVTTALLERHGVTVFSEEELELLPTSTRVEKTCRCPK